MQIEFTGRQTVVHAKLKAQAKAGLDHIEKLVGQKATAHVILTEEKFRKTAEVSVVCKACGDLSAKCTDKDMERALHDALAKVEKQALKLMKKATTKRRHPAPSAIGSVRLQSADETDDGLLAKKKTAKAAKVGPPKKVPQRAIGQPSLIKVANGVAIATMNIDQAVKAAAQADRDIFVFRDNSGLANVLYRRRDGQVEWIEVP